jgi:hypothetical protein
MLKLSGCSRLSWGRIWSQKTSTKMESRWAKQVPEMLHTPCINQRRLAPTRGQYHRSPTQDTEHGMYFSRPNHVGNGRPSPLLPHALQGARVCRMRRPDRRALDRGLGRKLRSKTR